MTTLSYQVGQPVTIPIDPFTVSAPICGSDSAGSITYQGYNSIGSILTSLVDSLSVSSTTGAITTTSSALLGSQTISVRGSVLNVHSVI